MGKGDDTAVHTVFPWDTGTDFSPALWEPHRDLLSCVSAELSISMGKMGSAVLFIPPCGGGGERDSVPIHVCRWKDCCIVLYGCASVSLVKEQNMKANLLLSNIHASHLLNLCGDCWPLEV